MTDAHRGHVVLTAIHTEINLKHSHADQVYSGEWSNL